MAINVFELFGTLGVDNKPANDAIDDTTERAGKSSSIFSKLGSGLKVVGAGMAIAAGAAGAAAIGLSKQVIGAYGEYEQLIGGVETLFGTAADKVQGYADQAFQTAGMSANQYMETVTGFSASLLQSLGGDTAKAADVADQAVTDMADNSNKMGSDISSIQNAYQGFAKQNYTMLDNLKLGYGGTKEEMARLLEDAEKISGIEYDISSFADVTEAIHVMQTEMGITGTTAKEATETIQGSLAGMGSAWQNLLAGLGNSNADIGKLVNDLMTQFGHVVKNITPVLENIVSALPTAINGLLGALGSMLPTLLTAVTSLFSQVLSTLLTLLPQVIPVAIEAIMTIVQTIIDNLPLLIDAAIQIIMSLVTGITQALPMLIPAAIMALGAIAQGIIENLPLLIIAGLDLLQALIDGIVQNLPLFVDTALQLVTSLSESLTTNLPIIIEKGIELLLSLIDGIVQMIPQLIPIVIQLIGVIANAIYSNLPQIIQGGIKILNALINGVVQIIPMLIPMVAQIFAQILGAILANLPQILSAGIELLGTLASGVIQAIPKILATVPQIFSGFWSVIKSQDWLSIGADIIKGIASGIGNAAGALWDAAKGVLGGFKDKVLGFFGIHSPSRWGRDFVGKMIPRGIAVGIEDDAYTMQDALTDAASALTFDTDFDTSLFDPNNLTGVATASSGGYVQTGSTIENQTNALLEIIIEILYQILEKDSDIILDGDSIVEKIKKRVSVALEELNDKAAGKKGFRRGMA